MADAITSQVLINNARRLVMKFTSLSDGTGETAATKVDVSDYSCSKVAIEKVQYCVSGMVLSMNWAGGPTAMKILDLSGDGEHCFKRFGCLRNNAATPTGDILFSTTAATLGSSYSVILDMVKKP